MANTLTGEIPFNVVHRSRNAYPPYAYLSGTEIYLYPGVYYPGTDLIVTVGSDIFLTRRDTGSRYFNEGYHHLSVPTERKEIRTITCGTSSNYVEYPLLVCDTGSVAGSWSMRTRTTDVIPESSRASYSDCPAEISRLIDASVSAFSAGTPVDIFGRDFYPQYTHSLLYGAVMAPGGSGNCAEVYRYPQKGDLVLVSGGKSVNIMQKIYPRPDSTENVLVVSAGSEYTMMYPTTVAFNDDGLDTISTVTVTTTAAKYGLPVSKQSHALTAWRQDRYLQISESAPKVTATYTVNTPLSLVGIRETYRSQSMVHYAASGEISEYISVNPNSSYYGRIYRTHNTGMLDGNPLLKLANTQHKTGLESVVASYSFLGGGYVCLNAYTFDTYPVLPYEREYVNTVYSEVAGSYSQLAVSEARITGAPEPPTFMVAPPAVLTACPPLAPKYSFNETLGAVYGMSKFSMSIAALSNPNNCYVDVSEFVESDGLRTYQTSYASSIPDVTLHLVPDLLTNTRDIGIAWYWSRADNNGGSDGLSPFSLYLSSNNLARWVGTYWSDYTHSYCNNRLSGYVDVSGYARKSHRISLRPEENDGIETNSVSEVSKSVRHYTEIVDTYGSVSGDTRLTQQGRCSYIHNTAYTADHNGEIHVEGTSSGDRKHTNYLWTDVVKSHSVSEWGTTGERTYFTVFSASYSDNEIYTTSRSVVSYVPGKLNSVISIVTLHTYDVVENLTSHSWKPTYNVSVSTVYREYGPSDSSPATSSTQLLDPVYFTKIRQMPTGVDIPNSFTLLDDFRLRLEELRRSLAQAEYDKKLEISAAISIEGVSGSYAHFSISNEHHYNAAAESSICASLAIDIYLGRIFQ